MKVIKKINNNVALCIDNNDRELIAFGNGIGFKKIPYELNNMSEITRTFYGINENYINVMRDIPEKIILFVAKLLDKTKSNLNSCFSETFVITLSDHVNFAIERSKSGLYLKVPVSYDIEYFYKKEIGEAKIIVKAIEKEFQVKLPKCEINSIAIHIINAQEVMKPTQKVDEDYQYYADIFISVIEEKLMIKIDKKDFSYYRFVSHIRYLLERNSEGSTFSDINIELFEKSEEEYKKQSECVEFLSKVVKEKLNWDLSKEDRLYLLLHINRLYYRGL